MDSHVGASTPRVNNFPRNRESSGHEGSKKWRYARSGPIVSINPRVISRSRAYWSKCIVGYIVDYRSFSAYAIKCFIETHWIHRGTIVLHRIGHIFVLHMENDEDRHDLLQQTMASFDGVLMVFERWYPEIVPRSVRFPYACMWVRICGLPFEYLNLEVANTVGHIFGSNFRIDQTDEFLDSDYLRIRVCMCLGEPLIPGFFLACEDGYLLWFQFRYEEVFKYCVRCDRVSHQGVNWSERTRNI